VASSIGKSLVGNVFAVILLGGQRRYHFLEAQVRLGGDDTDTDQGWSRAEDESEDTHDCLAFFELLKKNEKNA
jgi:hypothetical protein